MQDVIVSLNGNILKVTNLKTGDFKSIKKQISKEIVEDSRILDVDKFSEELSSAIEELHSGAKSKFRLNFVVEPENMYFRFVTLSKNSAEIEERIIAEIQTKLEGVNLDELYFSYVKIAPFVYQFVGLKKELLENLLDVGNKIGVEIHSVLPWVLLLPKYVGTNTSSIFVCNIGANPVVVLSELGGVYFVGSYDDSETPEKLNALVQDLSIYKRTKPIDKVYTFNYEHLRDVDGLTIHNVEIPGAGTETTRGFDENLLANYMLDLSPDTLTSQSNLLNLLPLPAVSSKSRSLVTVAAPLSAILIVGLIFGGFFFFNKNKQNTQINNDQVLGEANTETKETTQSNDQPAKEEQKVELDRKDLVVRIENGSGVNGIAGQTKEKLEKLGYKVIEIDTADESRDSTLYKFKTTKASYKDMLTADLKDIFPETVVEEGIEATKEYDLLIIVGTSQKL